MVAIALTQLRPLIRKSSEFVVPEPPERMTWTQSSMRQFKKCKRKWFWRYFMRLRTRRKTGPLVVGSAFHRALGEWYRGRRSSMATIAKREQAKAIEEMKKGEVDHFNQEDYDKATYQISILVGMLTGYATVYQHERDEWRVNRKCIEKQFKHDMGDYDFEGKLDLNASDRKSNFIVEHKTASRIEDSYIQRLPLDTQVRSYIYGAERLGIPIDSVVYDVVMKTKIRRKSNERPDQFNQRIQLEYESNPNKYFFREHLKFSQRDILAFVHDMNQVHAEYKRIIADPLFKNPHTWLTNDAMCSEYFKLCEYHELCISGLDRGTSLMFDQIDSMHEELTEE